jgi:hypothetical protein
MKILIVVTLLLAAGIAAILLYGACRWEAGTRELRARLEAARVPVQPGVVDFGELDELPDPVQRYFRTALKPGQPMVSGVRVRHSGTFNMDETRERWKPFTSDQQVITRRPGFDWNGRIMMAPALPVRVHDAYVAGEGLLRAALLGLFTVADLRGADDIAAGELMRFLAEAAWYPTALLPSQGVRWEGVDERTARATLTDGALAVSLLFRFDDNGLIDTVSAETRGRTVNGKVVPTPWQGRFWNYAQRDGMRIPLDGEVAWLPPEGGKPYWRGRITGIVYSFTLPYAGQSPPRTPSNSSASPPESTAADPPARCAFPPVRAWARESPRAAAPGHRSVPCWQWSPPRP